MDPELLAFVPKPVKAVLILFPVTVNYEQHRKTEDVEIRQAGKHEFGKDLLYFRQTIGNACGTYALLHGLANSGIEIQQDTPLSGLSTDFRDVFDVLCRYRLIQACKPLTPQERGDYLETSKELETAHTSSASQGQTAAPSADAKIDRASCSCHV